MFRNTFVKVEPDILKKNVQAIRAYYPDYSYYFGVVKGNVYGHGTGAIPALIEGGVNYLAVSFLEEALTIRRSLPEIPILCLEPVKSLYYPQVLENTITATVESVAAARELAQYKLTKPLKVHIKLDTGMSRLGLTTNEELLECLELLRQNDRIIIEGLYTHLATSGVWDVYYDHQIAAFERLVQGVDLSQFPIVHIDRSITLVHHKKPPFANGVRLGICLYGFNNSLPEPTGLRAFKRKLTLKRLNISDSILPNDLPLKTAFSLHTEVISLRHIKAGSFVGYGAAYIAPEDMTVATLPIGYYDGVDKRMKTVCIHHKPYEIIGDICMDMTMVKVDDAVQLYDPVEIFGQDISVRETARRLGTNAYRLLTGIHDRLPRIYSDDNENSDRGDK